MSMNMMQFPPAQNLPLTRADLVVANATDVTITTSETTLAIVNDLSVQTYSQLTNYIDITLGSATSVSIRYYYSPDYTSAQTYTTANWYQIPIKNGSTGVLKDTPSVIDSTSPTQTGVTKTIEDIPYSGAMAFKVTGTAVGASATLNNIWIIGRVN